MTVKDKVTFTSGAAEFAEDVNERWHLVHDAMRMGDHEAALRILCEWQDMARELLHKRDEELYNLGLCPRCEQSLAVHNDDGSCVKD